MGSKWSFDQKGPESEPPINNLLYLWPFAVGFLTSIASFNATSLLPDEYTPAPIKLGLYVIGSLVLMTAGNIATRIAFKQWLDTSNVVSGWIGATGGFVSRALAEQVIGPLDQSSSLLIQTGGSAVTTLLAINLNRRL